MKVVEAEFIYKNLIWQDSDRMSGAVCFYSTRIPVSYLFDYLRNGESVEKFASDYRIEEAVLREVIELASDGLEALLHKAA